MWGQWEQRFLVAAGYLEWLFCGYAIFLFVSTYLRHSRPKHARAWMRLISKWSKLKDKGVARIDRVWVVGIILSSLVIIVYASTRARTTSYVCPDLCVGIQQVINSHALSTVTVMTGQPRQWRFCPGNGVRLYKGYVIELYTSWTGWCFDLNGTNYYHVVTGKDLAQSKYYMLRGVLHRDCDPVPGHDCESDNRPALANNCRDTAADSDVVCDGDPKFNQETADAKPR